MQRPLSPAADKPSRMLWPALCHNRTHAVQQAAPLFDHLVGAHDECTDLVLREARERGITFVFRSGMEDDDLLTQCPRRLLDFALIHFVICIVRVRQKTNGYRIRCELASELQPFCHQLDGEYADS